MNQDELDLILKQIDDKHNLLKTKQRRVITDIAVTNRLNQVSNETSYTIFLDIIIALLCLYICYSLFNRMRPSS